MIFALLVAFLLSDSDKAAFTAIHDEALRRAQVWEEPAIRIEDAKFDRNPYGKGAEPIDVGGRPHHPLPNVESYGALLRAPSDRPEPAGFLSTSRQFAISPSSSP